MQKVKNILITGCSSGIGLNVAIALQQRGHSVFASARKQEDVEKLKAQGLESIKLDINDHDSIKAALSEILKTTDGKLDALFNNAGILQAGAISDLTLEMIRKQFETNVFGNIALIRQVLPIMLKQGHGRIIQNSSIMGIITLPFYGAYSASKFALEGFTHTLRQELYGTNVKVSLINPGPIYSQLRNNAYQIYQNTINLDDTLHREFYLNMEKSYFNNKGYSKMTQKPDALLRPIIHALESPNPRVHYYVGWHVALMALLKRLLPDRMLDAILRRIGN